MITSGKNSSGPRDGNILELGCSSDITQCSLWTAQDQKAPTESEQLEEQGTSQALPSPFPICPPTALPLNQIMPQAVCITWTKLLKTQKNIGGNHASWFKSSCPGRLGLLLFLLSWTWSTFVYLTSVLRFFHLYLVMKIKALKTGPAL